MASKGRTSINYTMHKTVGPANRRGLPTELCIYCFFPGGIWDEGKLTFEQASAKYPRDKFAWERVYD